ncbi:MAG: hypothetical protein HY748_09485 [Elusimicrobia bacterium]|nr:hypothetical protein [Elusimicrobiota bacterium]
MKNAARWLLSRPGWGLWLWLLAALFTALNIVGSHHPDERGQISAFLAFKLGAQPAAHMPWDFELRMRPWFQPGFYYALTAPLVRLAGYDYRMIERVILLVQPALLAIVALLSARMWQTQERRVLRPLAWFAAGVMAALLAGAAIDAWGYGGFALSPLNYFRENILRDRASLFGRQPWHWYVTGVIGYTLNPMAWVWLAGAAVLLRKNPWYAALFGGLALFLAAHLAVPHKEMRFLAPGFAAALPLLLGLFEAPTASSAPTGLSRWLPYLGLSPSYLKAVALLNAACLVAVTLFGLVQGSSRAERALWKLPPGSMVLTRPTLYASFGKPFAEMRWRGDGDSLRCPKEPVAIDRSLPRAGDCPLRDAFTFAMPPQVSLRYCPPSFLSRECAKNPGALALLSSADGSMNELVLEPWPVKDAFPPAWLKTDSWPLALRKRIYSFKLVRCEDFLASRDR